MTRIELRVAMRRQALDTAKKLVALAIEEYTELAEPTDDEMRALEGVVLLYEEARRRADITGE